MGDNDEYQPVRPIDYGLDWRAFGIAAAVSGAVVGLWLWLR